MLKRIIAVTLAAVLIGSFNLCAAERKVVAVMPLENVSGYDEEKVAEIMTEQLIVALYSSGVYTVVERAQLGTVIKEQGFQNIAVDPGKAVELGKLSGADYSMLGKVTMALVEPNPTANAVARLGAMIGLGDIGAAADRYVHKHKGKIRFEFRFVDNTTGEIVLAKTVEGSKSGSSVAEAFNAACKNAADNFLHELDDINPFRARVAEIDGTNVYIDRGAESGLRRGETLIVTREGEPIVVNGKIVAVKQSEVGKVKVVEVNSDYAVCKVESETNHIKKGDVVKRS